MSDENQVDASRRGLLVATCAAGGVAGLATAGAFVSTLQPSERAKAAGAPVEVDISALNPGEMMTVEWRGKPVWISSAPRNARVPEEDRRRGGRSQFQAHRFPKRPSTPSTSGVRARTSWSWSASAPPGLLAFPFQSGPQPSLPDDWQGGFLCPCHGSTFDMAGRVFKNKPAPDNLQVPRYMFERHQARDRQGREREA
jgi:ubiquinol-cytochrome c reductase iron-sulfur subunit